jgi:aldehyde:ferredoxin oxidoreductase
MPYGYMGKVLWADLGSGKIWEERPPDAMYRAFIGGYGLAARLIYEHQRPKVDPLGPENILGFATGILTGTGAPSGCRFAVAGKSPLTGTWGDASCGGFFGPELKAAGYDAVFVTGSAARPTTLVIQEGKARLKDASAFWGLDVDATEAAVQADLGDENVQIVSVGPAGEKRSLIAAVMHDRGRAAGRSGLGAVMGAKRLKAIAVRGTQPIPVADKQGLFELRNSFYKATKESGPPISKILPKYGTAGNVANNLALGATVARNWSRGGRDGFPQVDAISGDSVIKYQLRKYACSKCAIGCGGIFELETGPYQVHEGHKPEYETLAGFGTMCLNDNVESIVKANELCNRYGIDTISASTVVAFALECFEHGIITKAEADGLDLTWGNHAAIVALTEKLCKREGIGDVLADGVKVAAERIGKGAEQFAVHIHGQEPGYHDSKLCPSRGTAYVADPTPGRHTAGGAATAEFGRATAPQPGIDLPKIERYQYTGKGGVQAAWSNHKQIVETSGLCLMPANWGYRLERFIALVTGWDFTLEELLLTGERIQTLRHAFNVREGLRPADFKLPDRLIGKPPLQEGPTAGVVIDIDTLVKEYYEAMAWDTETGAAARERLCKLGLAELAADIAQG